MLSLCAAGPRPFGIVAVCLALGCVSPEEVAPGAPVLESFSVVDATGAAVALDGDGGPVLVPPRVTFLALFDRLLDPSPFAGDAGAPSLTGAVALNALGDRLAPVVYEPNGSTTGHLAFPPGPALYV